MKIKEVERTRDENLFEHSELFSSVAGRSVAFSQDFIVSLDFFGSFFYQEKNEHIDNQYIRIICYVELRLHHLYFEFSQKKNDGFFACTELVSVFLQNLKNKQSRDYGCFFN